MNKWLFTLAVMITFIGGVLVGFVLCNLMVVKQVSSIYSKQSDKQVALIETLAVIPKNMIQNTLTVKKVKKGSSIYYVPSSDLQAVELKMDSLFREFTPPDDTVNTPEKTFWEKIKFW